MTREVADLWGRALRALQTARVLAEDDPDGCAAVGLVPKKDAHAKAQGRKDARAR